MDTFFGKVKNPCDDCVDGKCTMNCSGRDPAQTDDKGSFGITREKDGTITVRVRSPNQYAESSITMARNVWDEVSSGPFVAESKVRLVDQRGTDVIGTGPACACCGLIPIPNCDNPACAFRIDRAAEERG